MRPPPLPGRVMENVLPGRGLNLVAGSWLPILVAWGLFTTPPLDISRSNWPIFKIQTAFDSTQRDLHSLTRAPLGGCLNNPHEFFCE